MVTNDSCADITENCIPGTSFSIDKRLNRTLFVLDHFLEEGGGEFVEAAQEIHDQMGRLRNCFESEENELDPSQEIPEQSSADQSQPQPDSDTSDLLDRLNNGTLGNQFDIFSTGDSTASFDDLKTMANEAFGASPELKPAVVDRQVDRLKEQSNRLQTKTQELNANTQKAKNIANEIQNQLDLVSEAETIARVRQRLKFSAQCLQEGITRAQNKVNEGEEPNRLAFETNDGELSENPQQRDVQDAIKKLRQGATMNSVTPVLSDARKTLDNLEANKLIKQLNNMGNRILDLIEEIRETRRIMERLVSSILSSGEPTPYDPAKSPDTSQLIADKITQLSEELLEEITAAAKNEAIEMLRDLEASTQSLGQTTDDILSKCDEISDATDVSGFDFNTGDLLTSIMKDSSKLLTNPVSLLSKTLDSIVRMLSSPEEILTDFYKDIDKKGYTAYSDLRDFVTNNSGDVTGSFESLVMNVDNKFNDIFTDDDDVKQLLEVLREDVTDLVGSAKDQIANTDFKSNVPQALIGTIEDICSILEDFRDQDLPPIKNNTSTRLGQIESDYNTLLNQVPNQVDPSIQGTMTNKINAAKDEIEPLAQSSSSTFQDSENDITDICDSVDDAVDSINTMQGLENPFDLIEDHLGTGYRQIRQAITSITGRVTDMSNRIFDQLGVIQNRSGSARVQAEQELQNIKNQLSSESQNFKNNILPGQVENIEDSMDLLSGGLADTDTNVNNLANKLSQYQNNSSLDVPPGTKKRADRILDKVGKPFKSLFSELSSDLPPLTDVGGILDMNIGQCLVEMPRCNFEILTACSEEEFIGGNKTIQSSKAAERIQREAERAKHKASDGIDKIADSRKEARQHKSMVETVESDFERVNQMLRECLE